MEGRTLRIDAAVERKERERTFAPREDRDREPRCTCLYCVYLRYSQ